ncbi:MAG: AbrB/MazE/SpoVT family DNA-binding domain-containing protein [Candidatus Latescibacterota bacterium]
MDEHVRVTVSSKYQVIIPLKIRTALNTHPGDKLDIVPYKNRLVLIPLRNIKDMRCFLKGMETTIERDDDRMV